MLLIFQIVFSVPIISLIESIGGERAGGEWGGWGAEGTHSYSKSSGMPSVCDIN